MKTNTTENLKGPSKVKGLIQMEITEIPPETQWGTQPNPTQPKLTNAYSILTAGYCTQWTIDQDYSFQSFFFFSFIKIKIANL